MCHFCRGLLWAVPPAHRDPNRYTAAPGAVPPRSSDQPIFYLADEGARPFQGRTTAPPRYVDLTAEDDPRGHDDEIFWEALSEPGDILLVKIGALYIRRRNLRRPQPKSRPRENFRLARRGIKSAPAARRPKRPRMRLFVQPSGILIALLGAAPLDEDPIEEPSPPGRDPIEDFS